MRVMGAGIAVLCLMFTAGCHSVAGTWELAPGQPVGTVSFGAMTLANDGTFTAEANYGGKIRVITGHYTYGGGEIRFDADGKSRSYDAMLTGDELTIVHKNKSVKMVRLVSRKGLFK